MRKISFNFVQKVLLNGNKTIKHLLNICYIGYVTKKPEYNIDSVNPLYLLIGEIDGFIVEENGSEYLNIALTDSNNEVLKKYAEVWSGIKDQVKKINNGLVR